MLRGLSYLFFCILLLASLAAAPVIASPLDDAKAAGLVGEQPDGYVGAVAPSPDVLALVDSINAKRRGAYEQIAGSEGVSVDDVARLAAEKLYRDAAPGEYLLMDGQWVQK